MKILILTCNTGAGHNAAAKALMHGFEKANLNCEIKDALLFASERTSKFICSFYVGAALHIPKIYGGVYKTLEAVSTDRFKSVAYYANKRSAEPLYKYIKDNGFDTVIATHIFPAETLTYIKNKFGADFKTYFIFTDYTCYPFMGDTDLDYYMIPHTELKSVMVKKGIPEERIEALGIPVDEKFSNNITQTEARRELGLHEKGDVILVMTGSMGFGKTGKILSELLKTANEDTQIVVITGNNAKMKEKITEKYGNNKSIIILGFTDKVSAYMDACNLIFTKPGGLTSTEAAAKRIPIILTSPIPGCENYNEKFFCREGMTIHVENPKDAAVTAKIILDNKKLCSELISAQEKIINKDSANDICAFVINNS